MCLLIKGKKIGKLVLQKLVFLESQLKKTHFKGNNNKIPPAFKKKKKISKF